MSRYLLDRSGDERFVKDNIKWNIDGNVPKGTLRNELRNWWKARRRHIFIDGGRSDTEITEDCLSDTWDSTLDDGSVVKNNELNTLNNIHLTNVESIQINYNPLTL